MQAMLKRKFLKGFVFSFENNAYRTTYTKYFLPIEIKYHNVMSVGKNFCVKPVETIKMTYNSLRKILTDLGDDRKWMSFFD